MSIAALHHVSIPVSDVDRSRAFYREILGLEEIQRPPFDFPGAWFAVGDGSQHLHLIGDPRNPTFRSDKPLDPRDTHFAMRVTSFGEMLDFLESKGIEMIVDPHATAGFPQIYILDPDRHVIEINAAAL